MRLSRRLFLSSGVGSLFLPVSVFSQDEEKGIVLPSRRDFYRLPSASDLCSHFPGHFEFLPNEVTIDGKTYVRNRIGEYRTERLDEKLGFIPIYDDVWADFDDREAHFNLKGESSYLEVPKDDSFDSLKKCLDLKWSTLREKTQKKVKARWSEVPHAEKQKILLAYFDPVKFWKTSLTGWEQLEFEKFNRFYLGAIEADEGNATRHVFEESKIGDVESFYCNSYPWLCTDTPNVSDRLIIYEREVHRFSNMRIKYGSIR